MCSQMDDPTQHDKVTRPRVYELSGQKPVIWANGGSVALAVLGEMLTEAEAKQALNNQGMWLDARVATLREARERIADAEQLTRVGYLR